jgi:uncharacterized protein
MDTAFAMVPTVHASRYLQQLCKHWSHNLAVEFDAAQGRVVFPKSGRGGDWPGDGVFTLSASPDTLTCRIVASAPGQLVGLIGAVESHLNRFAFREGELVFDWRPSTSTLKAPSE